MRIEPENQNGGHKPEVYIYKTSVEQTKSVYLPKVYPIGNDITTASLYTRFRSQATRLALCKYCTTPGYVIEAAAEWRTLWCAAVKTRERICKWWVLCKGTYVKVNFEIYIADRKKLPVYRQSFFSSAVLTLAAALPLVRCYFINLPRRELAEWTTAVDELNRPVSTSPVISACWRLIHYDVK